MSGEKKNTLLLSQTDINSVRPIWLNQTDALKKFWSTDCVNKKSITRTYYDSYTNGFGVKKRFLENPITWPMSQGCYLTGITLENADFGNFYFISDNADRTSAIPGTRWEGGRLITADGSIGYSASLGNLMVAFYHAIAYDFFQTNEMTCGAQTPWGGGGDDYNTNRLGAIANYICTQIYVCLHITEEVTKMPYSWTPPVTVNDITPHGIELGLAHCGCYFLRYAEWEVPYNGVTYDSASSDVIIDPYDKVKAKNLSKNETYEQTLELYEKRVELSSKENSEALNAMLKTMQSTTDQMVKNVTTVAKTALGIFLAGLGAYGLFKIAPALTNLGAKTIDSAGYKIPKQGVRYLSSSISNDDLSLTDYTIRDDEDFVEVPNDITDSSINGSVMEVY